MTSDWETAIQGTLEIVMLTVKNRKSALLEVANEVVDFAKSAAPVKTGRLRDSITVLSEDEDSVVVGSMVPYAGFQEYGTRKMRAHPFMHPALQKIIEKFPALFLENLEQ